MYQPTLRRQFDKYAPNTVNKSDYITSQIPFRLHLLLFLHLRLFGRSPLRLSVPWMENTFIIYFSTLAIYPKRQSFHSNSCLYARMWSSTELGLAAAAPTTTSVGPSSHRSQSSSAADWLCGSWKYFSYMKLSKLSLYLSFEAKERKLPCVADFDPSVCILLLITFSFCHILR